MWVILIFFTYYRLGWDLEYHIEMGIDLFKRRAALPSGCGNDGGGCGHGGSSGFE